MFSSSAKDSRSVQPDEALLDEPLLSHPDPLSGDVARPGEDGVLSDARPLVTPLSVRGSAYQPLPNPGLEENNAAEKEARRLRASEEALARQHQNQSAFESELRSQEERLAANHQRTKDDAAMAARLQREEEERARSAGSNSAGQLRPSTILQVQVPPDGRSGRAMRVRAPGGHEVEVVIPPGLLPGDTFTFRCPEQPSLFPSSTSAPVRHLKVRVPPGMGPGHVFHAQLPNGSVIAVSVPPGSGGGSDLIIPFDDGMVSSEATIAPVYQRPITFPLPASNSGGARTEEDRNLEAALALSLSNPSSGAPAAPSGREEESLALTAEEQELLSSLDPDLRKEVRADLLAQKRAANSATTSNASSARPAPPPQLTSEQLELLNSLDEGLREEVRQDMLAAMASSSSSTSQPPPPPPAPVEESATDMFRNLTLRSGGGETAAAPPPLLDFGSSGPDAPPPAEFDPYGVGSPPAYFQPAPPETTPPPPAYFAPPGVSLSRPPQAAPVSTYVPTPYVDPFGPLPTAASSQRPPPPPAALSATDDAGFLLPSEPGASYLPPGGAYADSSTTRQI